MGITLAKDYELVFSLNKQSDIETAIANGNMNKKRPIRNFAPILERQTNITDKAWYGKGFPFASFASTINKWYELRAQERSATTLEALYALAYVMGSVASTQADSVTNPNEYLHTVTFQDTSVSPEVNYTSFGEKFGTEETLIYSGGYLNSVTFTGNRDDHVTMSFDGGARKRAVGTWSSPDVSTASFLHTLFGTVGFGASGAMATVSVDVLSWNLTIAQNAVPWWLLGATATEEDLVSEILVGDQSYSGQVVFRFDKDYRDFFRNETTCEFEIVAKSPEDINNNPHSAKFILRDLRISEEDVAEEGSLITYVVNFGEESTLKVGNHTYLAVEVVTDIDSSELLVAA